MARRKDHTREELKDLIRSEAEKVCKIKGFDALTARALATRIGYSAGTIYNVYPDMDALKMDINFHTLGRLHAACVHAITDARPGMPKIRALAYAYLKFAESEPHFWALVFTGTHANRATKMPKIYTQRLGDIFGLIETTLADHAPTTTKDLKGTARLLWSCLHGITILTLDGRLKLVGVKQSNVLIDQLLVSFFK